MIEANPLVFVFCALPCEAKPLVKVWRLAKLPPGDHPFAVYADADRVLIVTGVGKVNMAAAVAYTMAIFRKPLPILLNIGIAGHYSEAVGAFCLANKIIDRESERCFYPATPFEAPWTSCTVISASKSQLDYPEDVLLDMEASAFYEAAVKFSSSELIQALKIVSDNEFSPISGITEQSVADWVGQRIPDIEQLIAELVRLRRKVDDAVDDECYQALLETFRFSVSRAVQLKALLLRWRVLTGKDDLDWRGGGLRDAKSVLSWLERQLEAGEFYL